MGEVGQKHQEQFPSCEQAVRKSVRLRRAPFLTIAELFPSISHDLFIKYDTDKDNHLSLNDVARAFYEISKKITSLPAVRIFRQLWSRNTDLNMF